MITMANEMRDRLVELIYEARKEWDVYFNDCLLKGETRTKDLTGFIADHLIENGVIVPPCKVGDTLYRVVDMSHTACNSFVDDFPIKVEPYSIIYENMMGHYASIPFEQFGKTIFLTKDQAEQKLKEMRGGNDL